MFFLYSSKDIAAAAVVAAAAATGGPKTKPQYYCRVTFSANAELRRPRDHPSRAEQSRNANIRWQGIAAVERAMRG